MPKLPDLPEFPSIFRGPSPRKREREFIIENLVKEHFLPPDWTSFTPYQIATAIQAWLDKYSSPEYPGFDITDPDDVRDLKLIIGILDSLGFNLDMKFRVTGVSEIKPGEKPYISRR